MIDPSTSAPEFGSDATFSMFYIGTRLGWQKTFTRNVAASVTTLVAGAGVSANEQLESETTESTETTDDAQTSEAESSYTTIELAGDAVGIVQPGVVLSYRINGYFSMSLNASYRSVFGIDEVRFKGRLTPHPVLGFSVNYGRL
jgi:hypothetical protein